MTLRSGRHAATLLFAVVSALLLSAAGLQPSSASSAVTSTSVTTKRVDRILFSRQQDGGGSSTLTIGSRGGHERKIAIPLTGEDFGRSVWSHDGRRILFSNIPYSGPDGTLIGFRPATSDSRGGHFHLLALPERPVDMYCSGWTPDDRRIICDDERGLFTMRASDGGLVIRLTRTPSGVQDVAIGYAPDGRHLAFIRTNQGDPADEGDDTAALFLARPDGTHLKKLTPDGLLLAHELAGGDWSPDGRHVATATADGRLVIVSVRTGRRALVPLQVEGDYFAVLPSYSPSGRTLAFSLFRGAPADLYRSDLRGNHVQQLTSGSTSELFADWRPCRRDRRSPH